jgi:hypothetical protein
MKRNTPRTRLIVSIVCLICAVILAIVYAVWENKEVRFLSAVGFASCGVICFKAFLEYLKDIGFGKKFFGNLRKLLSNLYKDIAGKLRSLTKDEDKVYVTGKKTEFQIKFEFFKPHVRREEKKSLPRLPKYSSITEDKQKIRYIYTVFLRGKMDKGYTVDPSRTSEEIAEDFSGDEKAAKLFACYPMARYSDENEAIDKKTIESIEQIIK